MKRVRIRVIILASWLVFFSILSRLLDPIAISNITVELVLVMVVAVLVIPRVPRLPFWAVMLVPITVLLGTKLWTGTLSSDKGLFLAVVEAGAITLTTLLSRWVSIALNEFETAVAVITVGQSEKRLESALSGEGSIYREVRRARNHQRPLALLSISVDEKSIKPAAERIVQELQQSMMKQYKLRGLSKMLCNELEDCAVIVQDTDHYLAVLPEIQPEEIAIVVERLRQKASTESGIEIKIGVATLPQDSYTFEGLVERATREMENDREPQACVVMEQYPIEHRISQ